MVERAPQRRGIVRVRSAPHVRRPVRGITPGSSRTPDAVTFAGSVRHPREALPRRVRVRTDLRIDVDDDL